MRARITRTLTLIALAGGVAMGACRFDDPETPTRRPPLLLRSATPDDSAFGLYDPEGLNFSVTFRRPIESDELRTIRFIPRAPATGPIEIALNSSRELVWRNVVLDPRAFSTRLLLDGPALPEPLMFTFFPGEVPTGTGAIYGHIDISRTGSRTATGALVQALRFVDFDEQAAYAQRFDQLLGQPVTHATLAVYDRTVDRAYYRLNDLEIGVLYMVVAILDTDGDGEYELDQDWWGYAIDPATSGGALWAPARGALDTEQTDVDLRLRAPGGPSPRLAP